MTLQEIIGEVRDNCGLLEPEPITDFAIRRWINEGQRDIVWKLPADRLRKLTKTFIQNLVLSTSSYDLQDDFIRMVSLDLDYSNSGAQYVPAFELDRKEFFATLKNPNYTPSKTDPFFNIFANKFEILPTPQAGDTLTSGIRQHYIKVPVSLLNFADVPELPEELNTCLIYYASARASAKLQVYDKYTLFMNLYRDDIAFAINKDTGVHRVENPLQVTGK